MSFYALPLLWKTAADADVVPALSIPAASEVAPDRFTIERTASVRYNGVVLATSDHDIVVWDGYHDGNAWRLSNGAYFPKAWRTDALVLFDIRKERLGL